MTKKKFLLIREIAAGLWNEMHHVLTQLLAAEILKRIPVVYWGKGSLYASSDGSNAFGQFFQPVSGYSAQDLAKEEFSFYPKRWNASNILLPNTHANGDEGQGSDYPALCEADVFVSDNYIDVEKIIPLMPEEYPLYGLNRRELFYRLMQKYIRLQKEAQAFIDAFYDENMKGAAFLAVHMRSSDKIAEVKHLHELNSRYAPEIEKVLRANPGIRIFFMTDCIEILEEYKKRYGDILIHTDCRRVHRDGQGVHFQECPDNKRKGFEIIRDTWLAARCDFFIGNGYSNVSMAISELKNWENDRIKLLY
ncbi:MAG: O-fucosyltransferase family protein [Bacillota bacterium]